MAVSGMCTNVAGKMLISHRRLRAPRAHSLAPNPKAFVAIISLPIERMTKERGGGTLRFQCGTDLLQTRGLQLPNLSWDWKNLVNDTSDGNTG